MIEKKYRNRLNGHFEELLEVITKTDFKMEMEIELGKDDKRISKGKVLILAMEHIRALKIRNGELERNVNELGAKVMRLGGVV
jgi:hypothetical protein